jgi:hypothetical protein
MTPDCYSLTALSIAGSVVQFVDFAITVVSKGNRIYRSGDGLSDKHHDLEIVCKDLLMLTAKLELGANKFANSATSSSSNSAIENLSEEAAAIAKQLLEYLNKVKVQGRF